MSTRFIPEKQTWKSQKSRKRRQRFLASERQGELYRHQQRIDNFEENVFQESSSSSDDGIEAEFKSKTSNIYSCLMLGINWWKHLKKIYPKTPERVKFELYKELKVVDIKKLHDKFGPHPTRADLKEIEKFLDIDLYVLYAGEFSPFGIAYRPQRYSEPLKVREVFRELEDANADRERPVVVLQASQNYFHELGDFYVFPTRLAADNFSRNWKNLWELVVKKRWPNLEYAHYLEKIKEVKRALALGEEEIWSIGDGVFKRLKEKYGVTVSIFISGVINDNKSEKAMVYTTDKWRENKKYHLNILVGGYTEHEFHEEFKKFTDISYEELMRNPDLRPTLYYNKQLNSKKASAKNLKAEAINNIFAWGTTGEYVPPTHQSDSDSLTDDSGDNEDTNTMTSFIVEDRTAYSRKKISIPKDVASFFDNTCEVSSSSTRRKSTFAEAGTSKDLEPDESSDDEFECHIDGVSIGKLPRHDSKKWDNIREPVKVPPPNVSFSLVRQTESMAESTDIARLEDFADVDPSDESSSSEESENEELPESGSSSIIPQKRRFAEADAPVINLLNMAPNIFDNSTLCRELPENLITNLYMCDTNNCLMTSPNKAYMDRHKLTCTGEMKKEIKQRRCGQDLRKIPTELYEEGFLESPTYYSKYFITYDIESFMSAGPFSREKKYHNLVTIACCTSDFKQQVFRRENMEYSSCREMVIRFVNYLNHQRKKLVKKTPECIKRGINFYETLLGDPETATKFTIGELDICRRKLRYLQDYLKLKVYAWNGERYDVPVLYPTLMSVFYEFCDRDCTKINIIKRGSGYMLIECNGICFRDFKNYTSPMSLEKLARSNGLNVEEYSKGCWPYEHFTTTAQCEKTYQFTPYAAYRSTMYIRSGMFAEEFNNMIYEQSVTKAGQDDCWPVDESFFHYLDEILQVHNISTDPVFKEAFENGEVNFDDDSGLPIVDAFDYQIYHGNKAASFFKFDFEKGCYQCDAEDPEVQDYFRYSVKRYFEGYILWGNIKKSLSIHSPDKKMDMLRFLLEYNLQDCNMLTACINAITAKYEEKFKVSIHADLSISKIAERIAFMMYAEECPPIYTIPSKEPEFYKDCRKNLHGGIVQVLHRAVCLNGPSDHIPKAATTAPDGNTYKTVISLDFGSLYPHVSRGPMTCGPGIMFKPDMVPYAAGCATNKVRRFFATGMFAGQENTSLESIRWLEWMNNDPKSPYCGKILHTYNFKEIQLGRYYVDGWASFDDVYLDEAKTVKKKVIFEYRGCFYHRCPYCKKKPTAGQTIKKKVNGKWVKTLMSLEELDKKENERMHNIVEILRLKDGLPTGDPGFIMQPNEEGLMEKVQCEGPTNFNHKIEIMYSCQWLKKWRALERAGRGPRSYDYPFLYKGARPACTGMYRYNAGVKESDFKNMVSCRDRTGRSRFCGFAKVNVRCSERLKEILKHCPPFLTKKHLTKEHLQGRMKDIVSEKEANILYPSYENVLCYEADGLLVAAPMLEEFVDLGVDYEVLYFVLYHRDQPFKEFVEKMRDERIACMERRNPDTGELDPDKTGAEVCKMISNSWIGRLAMNKSRFTSTNVVGVHKLWKKMREPRFKSSHSLRAEDKHVDPLYEVTSGRKKIKEDLPIHLQVLVYQNSKLHFFKFVRTLDKYLREGSFMFCYCDTDSVMLALTESEIKYCVKSELQSEWANIIVPQWFAGESERSKKEPGLLKVEARINSGWFLALSPKCYIMCTAPPSELERKILDKENRRRGLEVIAEYLANMEEPTAKIEKKSAKGCKRQIHISFFEYLACIFTDTSENRVIKDVPVMRFDVSRKRMLNTVTTRKALNFILKKRIVDQDCVRTYPLRNADQTLL